MARDGDDFPPGRRVARQHQVGTATQVIAIPRSGDTDNSTVVRSGERGTNGRRVPCINAPAGVEYRGSKVYYIEDVLRSLSVERAWPGAMVIRQVFERNACVPIHPCNSFPVVTKGRSNTSDVCSMTA